MGRRMALLSSSMAYAALNDPPKRAAPPIAELR
jgi:hypothetical protein